MKSLTLVAALVWAAVYSPMANSGDIDADLFAGLNAGRCLARNLAMPTYQQRYMEKWYDGPQYRSLCDTAYVAHVYIHLDLHFTENLMFNVQYNHFSHPEKGDIDEDYRDYTTGNFDALTAGLKYQFF